MMKEVVRAMDTGSLAVIGLVAFAVAFLAVVAYTLTLSKQRRDAAKSLPLDDEAAFLPPADPRRP